MRDILNIARKEMAHFHNSLLGYIFVIFFVVAMPYPIFWNDGPANIFLNGVADLRSFFLLFPYFLLVFVPALAMRSWAEERRLGTLEMLLSYPLKVSHLVTGKYLGNLFLLWASLLLTITVPIIVDAMGELDWGPVIGGYCGALALGAACLAISMCISALTQHQILAFVGSFAILSFLTMFHASAHSLQAHFFNVARGVIDTRDFVFYASVTVAALHLNTLLIRARFWRK